MIEPAQDARLTLGQLHLLPARRAAYAEALDGDTFTPQLVEPFVGDGLAAAGDGAGDDEASVEELGARWKSITSCHCGISSVAEVRWPLALTTIWNFQRARLSISFMWRPRDLKKWCGVRLVLAVAFAAGLSACSGLRKPADASELESPAVLPLTRVRLYESGVGYFERRGPLLPGKITLPVPAGHLDDALTTLVLLSSGAHTRDTGVTFASRLSPAVARARAGLPANQETPLSYDRLLVALRGERVALRFHEAPAQKPLTGTRSLTARVIDVVAVEPDHPSYDHVLSPKVVVKADEAAPTQPSQIHILLLSDAGELLRVDATQVRAVRPLNDTVAQNLNAAMSAHLSTRSNQRQLLEVTGGEPGKAQDIALAYLAEAPVWRASYRLRVGAAASDATSQLQAWALLHNDTDETWSAVDVELVLGKPTSFMYPLTAPRYERRNLENPEQELSSVPQLSTTTPDALWGDFSDYDGETFSRVGGEGVGGLGTMGYGAGYGSAAGSHRVSAPKVRPPRETDSSDLIWIGDLTKNAKRVRAAEEANPVFRLGAPINLAPQHSAMVPFLDVQLDAMPVAWFSNMHAAAERAVGLNNTTNHTLPAGPMVVYGTGSFLGEALLQTLQPGGRQFAQIGDEPDLSVTAGATRRESSVEHVDFRNGELRVHRREVATTPLSFHNQTGRNQRAYVALDVVTNGSVSGADDLDFETTSERPLGVFAVKPGSQNEYTLITTQALMTGTAADELGHALFEELMGTATIPQRERDILTTALPLLTEYEASTTAKVETEQAIEDLKAEVTQARSDLHELASDEAGRVQQTLMQRIFDKEDRLVKLNADLRRQVEESERRRRALESALSAFETFRDELLTAHGK